MKIGLFFGTFNPLHNGHLMLGQYLVNNFSDLEQVLFVPTPSSSFKDHPDGLLPYAERCRIIYEATKNIEGLGLSTVENELEPPHYTSETLKFLQESNPDDEFILIMGGDNFSKIKTFHNYKYILDNFTIYVLRRDGTDDEVYRNIMEYPDAKVQVVQDAPETSLSSTFIREQVWHGADISTYVPSSVDVEVLKRLVME